MSVHRLVTLPFTDPARCRDAYAEAVILPGVHQAAVIERAPDGTLDVPENHAPHAGATTVGATATGGLIGLLGGPLGTLIGATAGALVGDAAEARRDQEGTAALILLSADVPDGTALLVLDLSEESAEPVDTLAARYDTTARREPAETFATRLRQAWKSTGS
ncbi:histidine kinase [Streptomyces sp. NPDC094049]|uniref:histidine kinase n=1 Tax=Streptomyces sp. NPDC094049 TaxID=3154987 RepID=UPI003328F2AF